MFLLLLMLLQGAERGQFVQTANLTFEATLDSQSKAPPHGNVNNNHDRRSVSAASLLFPLQHVDHRATASPALLRPSQLIILKMLAMVGLEAFTFEYIVKWPVSLIISKKVVSSPCPYSLQ